MASSDSNRDQQQQQGEKRHRSIFDVPPGFFDSCRLLQSAASASEPIEAPATAAKALDDESPNPEEHGTKGVLQRWSCNTCKAEFDSLQDQRSHFKSDFHRFNIKLSIAGKDTVKEEDLDDLTSDSLLKDNDISSISGSDDEDDKESSIHNDVHKGFGFGECDKKKIFLRLRTGEKVSVWKCLLLDENESILFENDKSMDNVGCTQHLTEKEIVEKLKYLIHEPRNNTHLRVVLLASGGHFAGCIFDGNSVVAHKTYHRYVVRAKAGKKQSSKDASGRAASSAGASLRRHNELALKKEIQELLISWKPYFDASSCVFIYAPSSNRQLLFDGEKPYFSCQHRAVRHVPLTVRRPTLKEARRIYNLLAQVSYEVDMAITPIIKEDLLLDVTIESNCPPDDSKEKRDLGSEASSNVKKVANLSIASESESENEVFGTATPLHEAVKSSDAQKVLELLEKGLDPCIKDERGQTPYMLATEKEVRNIFRRFMSSNLDKWDWQAAKVPSALTKEMEESQAAKKAEKDAKRKARAKELKKLRKAREKKAQVQVALSQTAPAVSENHGATGGSLLSKEEELKRAQAEEREKRAAAAERRMAMAATSLSAQGSSTSGAPSSSQPKGVVTSDIKCSCCNSSLVGKVPFHRYNYKYCSSSCMHVHREILEDG